MQLRELFASLDVDGSGEVRCARSVPTLDDPLIPCMCARGSPQLDAEEFIQGIQQLDGQLTEPQCTRLMEQIDTDQSGTVDFNELTRALQKLDLRVEVYDYLLVCLRFFSAEMQRSATILRSRFDQAAQKAPKEGKAAPLPGELRADGVRALLKSLDAPFPQAVVQRIIGEMVKTSPVEAEAAEAPTSRSRLLAARGSTAPPLEKPVRITNDAFVRVVMSNGLHAVSSPTFKETPITSAANVITAVNVFAKKLGSSASFRK